VEWGSAGGGPGEGSGRHWLHLAKHRAPDHRQPIKAPARHQGSGCGYRLHLAGWRASCGDLAG